MAVPVTMSIHLIKDKRKSRLIQIHKNCRNSLTAILSVIILIVVMMWFKLLSNLIVKYIKILSML